MTHILNLTSDDPVIHLKAYGGVKIKGVEQQAVQCEIDAPQLATLIEEDGHVYVTVNASCTLTVPHRSSIEIERGMGSVKIESVQNGIQIEKVLGNLILIGVGPVSVEKVGGNFSVSQSAGQVQIEKVAGTLVVDDVSTFSCEKVGGNCYARAVTGDFSLEKAGGNFLGQTLGGLTSVSKVGGSFRASGIQLQSDLKVGGNIELIHFDMGGDLSLRAGGDISLGLNESCEDVAFSIRSGGHKIKINVRDDALEIKESSYDYQLGEGLRSLSIAMGGSFKMTDKLSPDENLVGDLSDYFKYEESALSELIQERINSATKKAEAKVKSAEIRLEKIREQVEKHRSVNVDVGFGDAGDHRPPSPTEPSVSRPAGKKGTSDEERLMVLKMLQDKKITVDEAETLFKALED